MKKCSNITRIFRVVTFYLTVEIVKGAVNIAHNVVAISNHDHCDVEEVYANVVAEKEQKLHLSTADFDHTFRNSDFSENVLLEE